MPHKGSWGLPDFGFTELLQKILQPNQVYASSGGSNLSGLNTPVGGGPQTLGASTANTRTPSGTGSLGGSYPPDIQGGRLPTSGGGGQTLGAQTQAPQMDNGERIARMRYDADLSNARNIRGQGQNTFDTLMKAITGFRDRAGTQFANAGQEITNTAGETLGSNARAADELSGQARARGRAMGLGDSSKFGLQNKVDANLASMQGSVNARRGENEAANRDVYDERLGQADTQEGEAGNYLRSINDFVSNLENQSAATYGGNLDNVLNYQRQIAALNPLNAGGLSQMTPDFSGIQNTLNGILGGVGNNLPIGGDVAGSLYNDPSLAANIDPRKRRLYA